MNRCRSAGGVQRLQGFPAFLTDGSGRKEEKWRTIRNAPRSGCGPASFAAWTHGWRRRTAGVAANSLKRRSVFTWAIWEQSTPPSISDALVATLRGIIADSTNRTNGILFKCAVEQGIMAHTIAAHFRDTMEDRRALRGYVVDEVKRTNGQIRFEDAQDVQRQLPDDTWRD